MNAAALIDRLEAFGSALPRVVAAVHPADARWKPPSGAWSILEIVRHLGDEEVEDFRTRLRLTLEDPTQAWPPINPEGVAVERKYNEGDIGPAALRFSEERARSITWLRGLRDVDWSVAKEHPKLGRMTAAELLGAWAAHDALHLRQIAKRMYELAARDCGEPVGYAGPWGP